MKMSSGYVEEQREMKPTNIKQNFGCLARHERIVEVWDQEHMIFQQVGNGPLCITPQQCVATKFSYYYDQSLKDKTKSELLGNIKYAGMDMSK